MSYQNHCFGCRRDFFGPSKRTLVCSECRKKGNAKREALAEAGRRAKTRSEMVEAALTETQFLLAAIVQGVWTHDDVKQQLIDNRTALGPTS